MTLNLKNLKQLANILGRGLVGESAPSIAAGIFVELFHQQRVSFISITKLIQSDTLLWEKVEERHQNMFRKLAGRIGDIQWLNSEWAINTLRPEFPGIASLFLNDETAYQWLEKNLEEIRQQCKKSGTD